MKNMPHNVRSVIGKMGTKGAIDIVGFVLVDWPMLLDLFSSPLPVLLNSPELPLTIFKPLSEA